MTTHCEKDDRDPAVERELDQAGGVTSGGDTPPPEDLALAAAYDRRRGDSIWGLLTAGSGGEDPHDRDQTPNVAMPVQADANVPEPTIPDGADHEQPIAEAHDRGIVQEGLSAAAGEEVPLVAELLPPEDGEGSPADDGGGAGISDEAVFEEVLAIIRRHFAVPDEHELALAGWVFFAHLHEIFRYSPFLSLETPTKRSGKTQILSLLQVLIPGSQIRVKPTVASFIRDVDESASAMLFDEAERWLAQNSELHTLLNAAHYTATAQTSRMEKGVSRTFRLFGPKAIASIGPLPDTLKDRCVTLIFLRKRPTDNVMPLTDSSLADYVSVGLRIARWAARHRDEVARKIDLVGDVSGLADRARDNWVPIIAIAEVLGPRWGSAIRIAAVKISRDADDESLDPGEQLLRDIQQVFSDEGRPAQMTAAGLHDALLRLPESIWPEFDHGRALTKIKMGRMLRRFRLRSAVVRTESGGKNPDRSCRVYRYADFEDLFIRYAGELPVNGTAAQVKQDMAAPGNEVPPEVNAVSATTDASQPVVAADPALEASDADGLWITARGVRAIRKRLGLTQAALAKLVGVSAQSVVHWEGKSKGVLKLRKATLKAVLAVRNMGIREARQKLDLLGGSLKKVAGEKKAMGRKKRSTQKAGRGARRRKGHSQRTIRSAGQVRR